MRRWISMLLVVCLISLTPAMAFGQNAQTTQAMKGPRKHLATIIMAGLAGAVLGLSTLSFYGRPQEKLNNIAIGFAVGVIGGTVYTTYQAATAPTQFMNSGEKILVDPQLQGYLARNSKTQLNLGWEF